MWIEDMDILTDPEYRVFAFDMEWVGTEGSCMSQNRIAEIACADVITGKAMCIPVCPLVCDSILAASTFYKTTREAQQRKNAVPLEVALQYMDTWMQELTKDKTAVLIGHNAFKADCIVLRHEMSRCGARMYTQHLFMDSLVYARSVLRDKVEAYDLSSVCVHFGIPCDIDKRHGAMYDTNLLVHCLGKLARIRGLHGPGLFPGNDSPLLIRGVGSFVAKCLTEHGIASTRQLASAIIQLHGNVEAVSCAAYMRSLKTCAWMTDTHVHEIAESCHEVLSPL
jgi:hypothetical protein